MKSDPLDGRGQPDFGRRLRHARLERGMSQSELADGVANPSYISMLESSKRTPSLDIVVNLAAKLGVAVKALTGANSIPGMTDASSENQYLAMQVRADSAVEFGDLEQACQWSERMYELATEERNEHWMLSAGFRLDGLLALLGQNPERHKLLELLSTLTVAQIPDVHFKIMTSWADAAWDIGRLREAEMLMRSALDAVTDADLVGTTEHVRALGMLIVIRCDLGEFWDNDKLIDQMIETAQGGRAQTVGWAHWSACVASALMNESEPALRHLAAAEELAGGFISRSEWAWFYRSAASVLLSAAADLKRVASYLERAEESLRNLYIPGQRIRLDAVWARFDLADGRPERAAERCAELLADGSPGFTAVDQARIHAVYARALAAQGDTEEAAGQFRAAADLFERISAYAWSARVLRELDQLRSS